MGRLPQLGDAQIPRDTLTLVVVYSSTTRDLCANSPCPDWHARGMADARNLGNTKPRLHNTLAPTREGEIHIFIYANTSLKTPAGTQQTASREKKP